MQGGERAALSLNYRLGPEFPFPAGLRDAVDAYRFLTGKGFPAASIVLAGNGAGGGLAFCDAARHPQRGPADAGRLRGDVALGRSDAVRLVDPAEPRDTTR